MRVRQIKIAQWRHFESIELLAGADAALICLVGSNGTGKTHILELISACAHRLGISQGIEIPRGDPFADSHEFELQFYLAPGVSESVDAQVSPGWDRTLTIKSAKPDQGGAQTRITAGGFDDPRQSAEFAESVIRLLNQSSDVHFVSLDADRAYPKKRTQIHEIAQAYEIDWATTEYTRGRSFKSTATLYDEWIKFFLAQENQSGTRLMTETRRARENGLPDPVFEDHFASYKDAIQKVLPHVAFVGVDAKLKTLLFDTTGLELSFDKLSGGEREIAFLIGQIDRFGLRQGLFLLDEPELHLNADLIRSWVSYLTGTVETGQIWLATHSLEAVEAAGQQATFVLERDEETRRVNSLARLDAKPVLSALSRAVGTPAFSISSLRFVFIEGEDGVGERERYRRLCGVPVDVRFMECGSCNEVGRRVSAIRALASEAQVGIRIGGVVDRDFRTDQQAERLSQEAQVFVLPVLEIENLFLHPETLRRLLEQNGRPGIDPVELIRRAADQRAGSWIFQNAFAREQAERLPKCSAAAKELAKRLSWRQIRERIDGVADQIAEASGYEQGTARSFARILRASINSYKRKRDGVAFWKEVEGKEVLHAISSEIGFADAPSLVQASLVAWERHPDEVPQQLMQLRNYLDGL